MKQGHEMKILSELPFEKSSYFHFNNQQNM